MRKKLIIKANISTANESFFRTFETPFMRRDEEALPTAQQMKDYVNGVFLAENAIRTFPIGSFTVSAVKAFLR